MAQYLTSYAMGPQHLCNDALLMVPLSVTLALSMSQQRPPRKAPASEVSDEQAFAKHDLGINSGFHKPWFHELPVPKRCEHAGDAIIRRTSAPIFCGYELVAVMTIGDEIEIEFHPHSNVAGLVLSIPLWYHMDLTVLP